MFEANASKAREEKMMGYISEVRCVIYGATDQVDALVASQALEGNVWFVDNIWKGCIKREKRGEFDVLELHDSFKWYDDSPHVIAWMNMLKHIDDKELLPFKLEYEFIRIGEDDGDIERESSEGSVGHLWVTSPQVAADWD